MFLGGEFILPGSIIFMGSVISRVSIGLSFMEARNKTFLVARKLLGLHHGGTKWLQSSRPRGHRSPPVPGVQVRCRMLQPGGSARAQDPASGGGRGGEKQPFLGKNTTQKKKTTQPPSPHKKKPEK